MQSNNRLLDDLAKVANGALSAAAGARQEVEQLMQQRLERFLNEHGWVTREEFEAVRDMARKAREAQEDLESRLAELEARTPPPAPTSKRATTKRPSKAGTGSRAKSVRNAAADTPPDEPAASN
jgi:BMFP domain-containing protein YqiC